jgi:hypothetical protein
MVYPALYQINTRLHLRELAHRLGRPATLDDLPDEFFRATAALGFDYVWFLGLWQTGPAGRQVSASRADWLREFKAALPDFSLADISGSPFAVTGHRLHRDFGPEAALKHLRARLGAHGLSLVVDFVANHTALDHPWVELHPEFYIHGSEADLEDQPHNYRRVATSRGALILAHGRDPHFPGWPDTFQLNYRHPGLREAMTGELLAVAGMADGVRADMTMLLLPEVFERTWGERSLPADGTAPMDQPFWPAAISRVRRRYPDFLFVAEVYWGLERELLEQGFDYCYDKELYDRLRAGDAAAVRRHLGGEPAYQDRLVRFLEDHDEPRAAREFPLPVHEAAAVITYLAPGMRFFQEGQLEGRRLRVPVHLGRDPQEPVDGVISEFYGKLLACLRRPAVRQGRWQLLEVSPAWEGNPTWDRFVAFTWEGREGERLLAAVNFGPTRGQGYAALPFLRPGDGQMLFQDIMGPDRYTRPGEELRRRGLYLDLPAWGLQVFACQGGSSAGPWQAVAIPPK